MKSFNLRLLFVLLCTVCLAATSFAQQTETDTKKDGKKKIVIITKKVDADGKVITEKIVKEGNDAEVIIIGSGENEFEIEQKMDVNVDVDNQDGERHVKIRIMKGGSPEVIEWNGEGEMPEALIQQLEDKGVNIQMIDGDQIVSDMEANTFTFRQPNACLGVRIGQKIEIENINGVETQTETGVSEDGVAIMDIIEDSGAEAAGLLADDIITSINGTAVQEIEDVMNALEGLEPGTSVSVNYLRNGNPAQTNATLGDCGDAMNVQEIEKVIEKDDEDINIDSDENKMVIIKKRKGQPDEIVEWEGDVDWEESPVLEFDNTLELETLDIFPNPTDGKVRIQFEAPAQPTIVKVIDLSGKEIYKEELNSFNGSFSKEIDLSKAGKGAFILAIRQGDKMFSEKLMVQ